MRMLLIKRYTVISRVQNKLVPVRVQEICLDLRYQGKMQGQLVVQFVILLLDVMFLGLSMTDFD